MVFPRPPSLFSRRRAPAPAAGASRPRGAGAPWRLALVLASAYALTGPPIPLEAAARGDAKVERRSYFFEKAKKEISYALFVPTGYREGRPAPLLVLLHGLGSNPDQVIRYQGITEEAEKRGYIVVAPYGYNERGWYGSRGKGKSGPFFGRPEDPDNLGELSELDVLNVLGIVREAFAVDADRIYLMGHSMGGGGAVYLGATYPELWAGLAPLAPALQGSRSILEKMKHLPVFVVTGEKDRLVPVANVRRWVARMKELGMDYRYKEIAGGNHFGTIIQNPAMIAGAFDFFDQHRRVRPDTGKPARGRDAARPPEATPYRTFTNLAGKTIRAKPLKLSGEKVTLRREDGRTFILSIDTLSAKDRAYLQEWAGASSSR